MGKSFFMMLGGPLGDGWEMYGTWMGDGLNGQRDKTASKLKRPAS